MKKHYKRTFLNQKKGTALIETEVSGEGWNHAKVTDCNRQITLEFNTYAEKDIKNSKYKLNKLIAELTAFKVSLFGEDVE